MRRDVFQAIADPVRREIIDILSKNEFTVNEVAEHFDVSRQAISKQLKILDECSMVNVKKLGRERYYSIEPETLIPAFLWIEQYQQQWEERIDSFEEYLNQLKTTKTSKNDK